MRIVLPSLLLIMICCTSKFFVGGEDYKYEYQFEVNKDLMVVEKFIINYTKYMKNRFRVAFHAAINKKRSPKKDVCQFLDNLKVFMCRVLIKLNYFGLTFVDYASEELICRRQEISLRRQLQNKLRTRNVNMFRCPMLQYRSLETEQVVKLPVSFYISNTQTEGTACLYIQYRPDYPIFPEQIVSNVDVDALFTAFVRDFNSHEPPPSIASLITYSPSVQRRFLNFMDVKRQSKPYQKFSQLYMKSSACGMPKGHKLYICRSLLQHVYFKFPFDREGYDEAKCHRRKVLSHNNNDKRFTMALFKCPPLYLKSSDSKQYLEHSLYLSTNTIEKSFLVYDRPNYKGKTIRLDSYVINLDNEILLKDRRRTREFLKRDYFFLQMPDTLTPKEDIPAVDPPTQQSLLYTPFSVTFDRTIVEDDVIQLNETRTMKTLTYIRFQRTFASINVTGLRNDVVIRLCQYILEEDTKYNLTIPELDQPNQVEDGLRKHILVRLVMREAEKLQNDKINSRQCPPVLQNLFKYFVSTSAKNDAVIMHVKYDHEEYYSVPQAFVNNIVKNIDINRPASINRSISIRP